ncbi:hypothetical protein [Actinophytocola sp. NPDC049390]|uniref:hypothetical protein n=1 Tax=Actinophytocola sp. NPDC049390 TaxID=3363894 RepID=UPI0037AEFBCD
MTETLCVIDEEPADGAQLCRGCLDQLAARLREVPGLVDELEVTITRQDKVGVRGGGGSKPVDPPLPFNLSASDARTDLRDKLLSWAGDVAERSGARLWPVYSRGTAATASVWLLTHLRAVAHHPAAGDLYEEITEAVWRAVKAVDQKPGKVFAGWCCAALYAPPGRSTAVCRECGTEHDVQATRDEMRAALEEHRATAADAARMLEALGVSVTPARIRKWAHRGKVVADGRGTYRLGDLVQAAAA